MAFRVDVDAAGVITIMRPEENREHHHLSFKDPEMALMVMELFLKDDLTQSEVERYKPEIIRKGREAFRELEKRSPYYGAR